MKPFLPQYAPFKELRKIALEIKKSQYIYNYDYIEPLPMLNKLPLETLPSFKWLALVAEVALKLLLNTIQVKKKRKMKIISLKIQHYLNLI